MKAKMDWSLQNLDIATIVFYAFSALLISSAIMVISVKNSVYSVFFLIFSFFTAAGLFVLIGAEYLAMTLVIVYVGAVAVLFLFVVMMLNLNFERLRAGFLKYLPVGILIALALFIEMGALFYTSFAVPSPHAVASTPIQAAQTLSNTEAIGRVLYTKYMLLFQLAGVVLLVAMIGAIVLTLRHRVGVKRQSIAKQVARQRHEAVALVDMKPGQGV